MPITFFDRSKNSVGINCFPKYEENIELNGKTLSGSVIVGNSEPKKSEEVWFKKDSGKKIYIRDDNGSYEEFFNEELILKYDIVKEWWQWVKV